MSVLQEFRNAAFKDTSFANLMQKRVYNILLIATKYDSFMLEDDGRVDEQIFNEYMSLSLRYPPRFRQVTTEQEAMKVLSRHSFELIIFMPNMVDRDIFGTAKKIKEKYPATPIVVLTPFSKEVSKSIAHEDISAIDYVFSWLGNSDLLLAIIKLVEDKMNAPADTRSVGVQVILLVEDSIRFYSAALPQLYKVVLEQSREFAKEALNEHQKTLRMRGRPKILLARSYEEAVELYEEYKGYILGVVSDFSFMREGVKDPLAGLRFCRKVRGMEYLDCFVPRNDDTPRNDGTSRNDDTPHNDDTPRNDGATRNDIPIILESSETDNEKYAEELGAAFISKNSKTYPMDLRSNVIERFGFGDFVIINPASGQEIMRIKDLKDLQSKLFSIPDDSLRYHLTHNHFSRFLYSRALFPPAELLRQVDVSAYDDMNEARQFILEVIVQYRKMKNVGVVAVYQKERFDEYSNFARIGDGSLGGKGRGLAFIGAMIKRNPEIDYPKLTVNIPKTVVLCTDIFDEFMETNNLYSIALSDVSDEEILKYFLRSGLPTRLISDLMAFFEVIKGPVAVRSSSLLEDAHYQPFAGVYSTYMAPFVSDKYEMLESVSNAIKGVYASVYYRASKAYMLATSNLIESEKMAVVLQEVVGRQYGRRFYPTISGVAKSLNFYPVGEEKTEEGIVNIALGLGKYVVDGGVTLRFSPFHPRNILQLSTVEYALKSTQTQFLALDLTGDCFVPRNDGLNKGDEHKNFGTDDSYNLLRLSIREAEKDGVLKYLTSTYDPRDNIIRDGYYPDGRKILSFSGILKHNTLPLSSLLANILKLGCKEMGRPVEIEFAVDIAAGCRDEGVLYLLQIRPIVDNKEILDEDLSVIDPSSCLLFSHNALGHGIISDVYDIIYVRTRGYNAAASNMLASEIVALNRKFTASGQGYILVGPGRWGSSDPWLGIPVKWSDISNARVIAEISRSDRHIEPSQGTHFFQNLTSNGVGYFTIRQSEQSTFKIIDNGNLKVEGTADCFVPRNDALNEIFNEEFLDAQSAVYESDYLRHVRFPHPVIIKMDGKRGVGVVLK
ncbi:MAG: phosphoenolpyruvate synthase [Tannerella sp.]|jgi:DNA-binding response OmpR family regulator|nr:phosphoenolpyruvate synthase [Tannerella sp.]